MVNFLKGKQKEPENIEDILKSFKELEIKFKKVSAEFEAIKAKEKLSIQKVGMLRFNPFKEVGSDQSFSVALLDGENSGVVITSLYSRDGNRVYAKPIQQGQSQYLLSDEEKEAIAKAMAV